MRRNPLKQRTAPVALFGGGLGVRAAAAAAALPVVIILVWLGAPWLTALAALAAAGGALEAAALAGGGRRFVGHLRGALVVWAVACVAAGQLVSDGYAVETTLAPALAGGALVSLGLLAARDRPAGERLADWVLFVGAGLYVGGTLAHAPLLRGLEQGREWVLLLLAVTFAADTGAYAVGRAVGRRPMAPSISPGKTWEGSVGGIAAAIGAGFGMVYALDLGSGWRSALALGAMTGVSGQLGDLLESKLKRAAGVKHSGWVIPGHGGVLDRLDSIVLNLVVVYHFVRWVLL